MDYAFAVGLLFNGLGYGVVLVVNLHLAAWGLGLARTAFDFRDQ